MDGLAGDRVELGKTYLCFGSDVEVEEARQVFAERYGYEASQAVVDRWLLWVGPLTTDFDHGLHGLVRSDER